MNKWLITILLLLSGLLGFLVSLYFHKDTLSPTEVSVMPTFHYPTLFVQQLAGDPDAGRKIFKEYCSSCHNPDPVIDVHAPAIGDNNAWQARKKHGMNALLNTTINGHGAMPARGGCFECSDEQLRQAIIYILSQS